MQNLSTDMPIKEYVTKARDLHNPSLDLSFMDFFMDMYDNPQNVSAELLSKYGILSIRPGRNTLHGNDIKKLFTRCHLVESVDYQWRQLAPLGNRGGKPKDVYTLTPKAFKICLISSQNENKYRDYFLFLEECIHYYNIGQMNSLKNKIEDLQEDLDAVNEYAGEQENIITEKESEIDRLLKRMDDMMAKMDKQSEQMTVMQQQNTEMQSTLDKIVRKLDDRAIPPSNEELTERFVLMKKDSVFYVIRSQERRIPKVVKEKELLGYTKVGDLIESETIPNSTYLWNVIRDELVKERKIKTKYNEFTLRDITEQDLVNMIKEVFKSRKDLN